MDSEVVVAPPVQGGTTWWPLVGTFPGTLTNMAADAGWHPTARAGWWGEMRFDGDDDSVAVSDNAVFDFANTTATVSLWVRTSGTTGTTYFLAKRESLDTTGWGIRINATGAVLVRIHDGGGSSNEVTSVSTGLNNNAWFHLAAIVTTSTTVAPTNMVTLYINGLLDQGMPGTATTTYVPCTACVFTLGAQSDQVSPFVGALDQVLIWNRALSATEIRTVSRLRKPTLGGLLSSSLLDQVGLLLPIPPIKRKVTIQ
jgi:hypothetical protein